MRYLKNKQQIKILFCIYCCWLIIQFCMYVLKALSKSNIIYLKVNIVFFLDRKNDFLYKELISNFVSIIFL